MLRFSKVVFTAAQDLIRVEGSGTRTLESDKYVLTHIESGVLVQHKDSTIKTGPWWFADHRIAGTMVDPESIKVK